ncbi:MAG: single-stranded DNA-binding protein [Candidatus Aenigmatarchaeota archaeon]
MYNRIILIGNLTKDPELRYTPQGTPVGNFRLAVNSKRKQGDEWIDDPLFIDVVLIGSVAETCNQYLVKGNQVLVEGRLQERRWESEGQKRSKIEVIAQSVRFLGKKKEGNGETNSYDDGPEPF